MLSSDISVLLPRAPPAPAPLNKVLTALDAGAERTVSTKPGGAAGPPGTGGLAAGPRALGCD